MVKTKVDFNSDIGESFGQYKLGLDGEIIQHVSSVNIGNDYMRKTPKIHGIRL